MLIVAREMFGVPLEAAEGRVGTLYDVLFDDQSWKVRHLVVDTTRAFHGRQVLLDRQSVEHVDWRERNIRLRLSHHEVGQCASVGMNLPVARREPAEPTQVLVSEAYWTGSLDPSTASGGDPHLRSARLLAGVHIHCRDGRLGHLEDFVIDDSTWSVGYLVVDTRNWWPGKSVLIEAAAVESIRWQDREIHVILSREEVERRPAYDGTMPAEEPVMGTA